MKELSFSELKVNLIHYFLHVEKYKLDKNSSDECTYLTNASAQNSIIVIFLYDYDKDVLKRIESDFKSSKHAKVNVLKIALSKTMQEDDVLSISEPMFYKDKLEENFPKIVKLKINSIKDSEEQEEEVSEEEIIEMLKNPESSSNKELQELTKKIKIGFTPVSWIIALLFFVLPLVSFVLTIWMQTKNSYLTYGQINSLFFGGTDRNLTILGFQFWRILTYGFNDGIAGSFLGVFEAIIFGYMIYSNSRYIEAAIGPLKLGVTVFASYILTGFLMSVIPGIITGGSYGVLASLVAILALSSSAKKTAISYISKAKMIIPIIVLILVPMFDGNIYNYLVLFASMGFSGSIMFLWFYNYKKIEFDFAIPLFSIGAMFTMSFVLIFAFSPVPAYNSYDIYALQSYLSENVLFSMNSINNTMHNIGWTSLSFGTKIDSSGSIVWQLFTNGEIR